MPNPLQPSARGVILTRAAADAGANERSYRYGDAFRYQGGRERREFVDRLTVENNYKGCPTSGCTRRWPRDWGLVIRDNVSGHRG